MKYAHTQLEMNLGEGYVSPPQERSREDINEQKDAEHLAAFIDILVDRTLVQSQPEQSEIDIENEFYYFCVYSSGGERRMMIESKDSTGPGDEDLWLTPRTTFNIPLEGSGLCTEVDDIKCELERGEDASYIGIINLLVAIMTRVDCVLYGPYSPMMT